MIHEAWHEEGTVRSKLTQSLGGITKVEFEVGAGNLLSPFLKEGCLRFDTSVPEYERRLPSVLQDIAKNLYCLAAQVESRLGKEMTVDEMAEEVK